MNNLNYIGCCIHHEVMSRKDERNALDCQFGEMDLPLLSPFKEVPKGKNYTIHKKQLFTT